MSNYDPISSIYDLLAALYSGRSISRSKLEHLKWVQPGQSVLYAGAGTGAECIGAAKLGAQVTVCDESARMLSRARQRFDEQHLEGLFEQSDALRVPGQFDMVVAPYFLNVFASSEVGMALASLTERVRAGGSLVTVDFRAPSSRLPFWLLQRLYYFVPQLLFLLLTRNPWHPLYDYPSIARAAAPELKVSERICTRTFGIPLLETIRFSKPA